MHKWTRRALILTAVAAGSGALVTTSLPTIRREIRVWRSARPLGDTPWIRIDNAGIVTAYSNVTEMGQGAVSGLMQGLAEELDISWNMIRSEMAPVTAAYSAPWGYSTGGSRSIRALLSSYRYLGASARHMIVAAAAKQWNVKATECTTRDGEVHHEGSQRSSRYAALAAAAAELRPPRHIELKPRSQWRYIGRSMPRLDSADKIRGTAIFGLDVSLPKMKIAALSHAPVLGGSLRRLDPAPALSMRGVYKVVILTNAVAVVADTYWHAKQALAALQPEWDATDGAKLSSSELRTELGRLLGADEQRAAAQSETQRDLIDKAESELAGEGSLSATYEVPLLAQAPAEPMNAVARVMEGSVEIWAPTQAQSDAQVEVAKALGVGKKTVQIHTTMVGGGFGRRLSNDYMIQAAIIARDANVPVKLIWSREEDMRNSTYRTAAAARLRTRLLADGTPSTFRVEMSTLHSYRRVGGIEQLPYRIPPPLLTYIGIDTPIPIGSWRSVDMSQNTFFVECFMDECAAAAGSDPLAYRLQLLQHDARASRVLKALSDLSGWQTPLPSGRARGIAFAQEFGSVIAQSVEVEATETGIVVRRVDCALDCGLVVNPDAVEAQVQGGIIYALSAALFGEITIERGQVQQSNFDTYRVLRMGEVPEIRTHLLEAPDTEPGGVGEIPVPALAPALTNAISRLIGKRVRVLPLKNQVQLALATTVG